MAAESKRELILQNLKTTLEGINGEDPYWTEVKTVKRVPFVPTEFEGEDKPGLLIVATVINLILSVLSFPHKNTPVPDHY